MIKPVQDFVQKFVEEHGSPNEVLEIGSRNINGGVRHLFHSNYTGVDLQAGADVEVVMDAMDLRSQFKEESVDCVICLETLEHVKNPLAIVDNMRWVLKYGGWMIITTPGIGHPRHDWPADYYRFFEDTYRDVFFKGFENCRFETKYWDYKDIIKSPNDVYPMAVMGWGQKAKSHD